MIQDLIQNPVIKAPFWEDFEIRFCWSSNVIEGNTLSLDETIDFLLYDEVQSRHTYQEYTEAKNCWKRLQNCIFDLNESIQLKTETEEPDE